MQMVEKTLLVLTLMVPLLSGCAGVKSKRIGTHVSEQNIIFNPDWTGLATNDVVRAAWPTTDAYVPIGAEISDYEERIVVYQGPSFRQEDQYYRRVNSVRTRRHRR